MHIQYSQQEVNLLLAVLNVQPGAALLEIQCGYGRHLVELVKRGYQPTSLDISAEFLATLTERVAVEQISVQVIQWNSGKRELARC